MEDVAHELRTRRESLGLSVHDLFSRTRINAEFITALEAGDFHVLPEAYIRMFLRKVAQEVGADPDEVIVAYDRATLRKAREDDVSATAARRDTGSRWVVVGASSLMLIGLVGLILLNQDPTADLATSPDENRPVEAAVPGNQVTSVSQPEHMPVSAGSASESTASTARPSATASPLTRSERDVSRATPTPSSDAPPAGDRTVTTRERVVAAYSLTPQTYGLPGAPRITLSAIGLGTSTIAVRADGEPLFAGLVASGRRLTWEAEERFLVEVDRGSDVRLDLLGKTLATEGALAEEGRKVRLFISRASIWVEEIEPSRP